MAFSGLMLRYEPQGRTSPVQGVRVDELTSLSMKMHSALSMMTGRERHSLKVLPDQKLAGGDASYGIHQSTEH